MITRHDSQDAEEFERMLQSKPWGTYYERLIAEVTRQRVRCVSEENVVALRQAQGAAAFGEALLAMPNVIFRDLRKDKRDPANSRV